MINSNTLMKRCLFLLLFVSWTSPLFSQSPKGGKEQEKTLNYIFEGGNEGYKCFRIPAVVTTKKVLYWLLPRVGKMAVAIQEVSIW